MTRTRVSKGKLRCAAVIWFLSNFSPDAVGLPCHLPPYQIALPRSTRTTRSVGWGGGGGLAATGAAAGGWGAGRASSSPPHAAIARNAAVRRTTILTPA